MRFALAFVAVFLVVGLFAAQRAEAQQRSAAGARANRPKANKPRTQGRFTPARPTTSPYLNLFRTDPGLLPNYQQFVRPEQEQRAFQQQQKQFNQDQTDTNGALQQGIQQMQTSPGVAPTGIGSVFRNFSHYYSGLK